MDTANTMYKADEYVPMDIFTAAQLGQLSHVKQCIFSGIDMNERNVGGWTPLHYAAYLGHVDVCKYLIDSGAAVNSANNDGCTALMLAALCGLDKCVETILLATDSNLRAVDKKGHTALMHAVVMRHMKCTKMLLAVGSDPNLPDHSTHGITPLMMAAAMGHEQEVQLLLANGGDVSHRTRDGKNTAYSLAMTNKRMGIVEMMDKHMRAQKSANKSRMNHSILDAPRMMAAKMTRRPSVPKASTSTTMIAPATPTPLSVVHHVDDEGLTPTRQPRRETSTANHSLAPSSVMQSTMNTTLSTTVSSVNTSMLNNTRTVGGISPDGPLPTDLRTWLVDDLKVAVKHYDSLLNMHPGLSVSTFVQLDEDEIKRCVKCVNHSAIDTVCRTIGPRRKMVVAIKAYNERQAMSSDVEETSSNASVVSVQQVYKRMFEELKAKTDDYREASECKMESQKRHICLLSNTLQQHAQHMQQVQQKLRQMHIDQLRAGNTEACDMLMMIKDEMQTVESQLKSAPINPPYPY